MLNQTPFLYSVYSLLLIRTILTAISPNWLIAWIILEVNMLRFIPIIIKTKSNQETEASIKYFLAQAIGSIMILLGISIIHQSFIQRWSQWIILIAIFIKLGIAPCHFWYPSVISSLSWINCLILSTWQKLAPLILLSVSCYKIESIVIISIISGINALVGGIIGINQTHLRSLLAYSSIGHIGWMLSILVYNKILFCGIYFIIYSIIIIPIFLTLRIINSKTIKTLFIASKINILITLLLSLCIISLAGIPPLTGFIPKIIVIIELIKSNFTLIIILLIGAYINLYYYLNITFNLLININIDIKNNKINYRISIIILISTSTLGILPIII